MNKKLLSILISFAFLAPSALATFSDVPSSAWYRGYVEQLKGDGIIDAGDFFRPADSLNRAELVKMVITATGGLEGYTPPFNPTFDDVPSTAWFANYVEGAATRGIVMGYMDAEGNLTGQFGPADTVTRAAATKILVEAFDLEQLSDEESGLADVREGDWFHDYVAIAQQHGFVEGYSTGYFGPADPVTRAQIAKMLVLGAQAAGIMEEPELAEETEETVIEEEEEMEEKEEEEEVSGPLAEPNLMVIEEGTVSAGTSEAFVARYSFKANNEGFHVETVTIVNDITGDDLGDEAESTPAIKNVVLKYPDKDGILRTSTRSLDSSGKARFADLDFFAKRDDTTFFEVYVDLNKVSDVGESLSGETFRLGIQDTGNTSDSFRAVGDISGFVVGYGNTGNFSVENATAEPFTVRKTVPGFSINSASESMKNGENTLLDYSIAASSGGSVGIARLVFEVVASDSNAAGLELGDFKLYRGSSYLSDVTIYDGTGGQDVGLGSGNTLADGTSHVIVSFDQEETISSGDTENYSLRASISGSETNDSVSTRLALGDEQAPLSGLTAVNQENTGKIYVDGDATAGIFTNADTDLSQWLGTAKNIIWSDKSAESHLYPTVAAGLVTDNSGSADWTNGYLLDIVSLPDHVISK